MLGAAFEILKSGMNTWLLIKDVPAGGSGAMSPHKKSCMVLSPQKNYQPGDLRRGMWLLPLQSAFTGKFWSPQVNPSSYVFAAVSPVQLRLQ